MPTCSTRGIRYRPDTRWGGTRQIRTTLPPLARGVTLVVAGAGGGDGEMPATR